MPGGNWAGVIVLAEVTLMGVAVVGCVLYLDPLIELGRRLGRRLHLVPPAAPVAVGMPIERIAADLRRIRPQALRPAMGTPYSRRQAIIAAYDDALLDACRALGVSTELDRITDTLERESERLRAEHELGKAGVDLNDR
jgi:hypothetical protein